MYRTKHFRDKIGHITVNYYKSRNKNKKWCMTHKNKEICWGHPDMQDYTQHHDKIRRKNFRRRFSGILLKDGSRAIDKRYSPAWLAYYVTW